MTVVVPFDGSALARTALARAATIADCRGERLLAVTVLPTNASYAREKGWLGRTETFDADAVAERLEAEVREVAPDAEFQCEEVQSRVQQSGVARRLRNTIENVDATTVFLGSENVGRIAKPISSIGTNVAARTDYDIYLVQRADPEHE